MPNPRNHLYARFTSISRIVCRVVNEAKDAPITSLSSVMDADLIIVMENGRISAKGTHDELLKSSEVYREVYTQQTKAGDENE